MPSTPEPAATVILLRDSAVSPEVLMLERHARSTVLPDLYVFPGGRVDDQDRSLTSRLDGFSVHDLRLEVPHMDREEVEAFLVAAIRETFEEAGILLARRRGSPDFLEPEAVAPLLRHQLELQSGRMSFGELIEDENLELAAECLTVHGHWITPEVSPRRFDTLFFAAITPAGQTARHDGIEVSSHTWIRPEDALEEMHRGQRRIIFPTACNLETLTGFPDAQQAFEGSRKRRVVPVVPKLVENAGKRKLVIPREAGYSTTEDDSLAGIIPKPQPRT